VGGRGIPTPNVEFSRRGREVERKGKVQKRSIIREMIKRRDPRYFLEYIYPKPSFATSTRTI
jgi:hypothetical protein